LDGPSAEEYAAVPCALPRTLRRTGLGRLAACRLCRLRSVFALAAGPGLVDSVRLRGALPRARALPPAHRLPRIQYLILLCTLIGVFGRYAINAYEEVRYNAAETLTADELLADHAPPATGWDEKGRYLLYLNVTVDFFKLAVYAGFFVLIVRLHGL